MAALEHVEVHPFTVVEPPCRGGSSSGVEGHYVVLVYLLDSPCHGVPHLGRLVATDITANHPDDVWTVFISLCQELAQCLCLFDVHVLQHGAPDAVHGNVDAVLLCHTHNVV